MKFHHIGIVVADASEAIKELTQFITFDTYYKNLGVTSQKVDVHFLQIGGTRIELVEPYAVDSLVYKYSQKGGGFHHLCFEVENLQESFEQMVMQGAKPIVKPIIGFEDRLTAFLFLPLTKMNCNLIELAEMK